MVQKFQGHEYYQALQRVVGQQLLKGFGDIQTV